MELKVPNSQVTKEAQNGSLFEATASANAQGRLLGIHSLGQCSREAPGDTQSWGKVNLPGSGQARGLAGVVGGEEE